ncbi:hypothetical protein [Paenibacillus amylolyticus]|uniref:hypothetical protein n=1 Tax=Paenibacillus amylolyticus TaxID=1451 RepID=UPI00249B62F8|nr:hypothetical protein [Paenibacillus amylolyticus]WFA85695.1 hypothetical protein OGI70_01795 [Paenibacillus amylolyticus]
MRPELFSIIMYPTVDLNQREVLGHILDAFEATEKFTPTHWGNNEMVKIEYNRNEIFEKIFSVCGISEIHLYRNNAVKFSGSFELNMSSRSFLKFDFHKSMPRILWPTFFELSDKIAEIVKPSYGVTHIFGESYYPWSNEHQKQHVWMDACSYPVPVQFLQNGPLGVGSRTYFGSYILDMIDREVLLNSPGVVSKLDWGGISIDIFNGSFGTEEDRLTDNWLRVMKYLEPSQVFAIPSFDEDRMGVSFHPNMVWKEYLRR